MQLKYMSPSGVQLVYNILTRELDKIRDYSTVHDIAYTLKNLAEEWQTRAEKTEKGGDNGK